MHSLPSTVAAAAPAVGTLRNPLRFQVGEHNHFVVVTNSAAEAGEWVRRLPPPVAGTTRIVGLSFHQHAHRRADGFVVRRVDSLHLAFLAEVLVYHLSSATDGMYSPKVLSFLREPGIVFAGEDVDEGLYLLGAPFHRRCPLTMDLFRVAEVFEVAHLVASARDGWVPLHVVLGRAVLGIPENGLRVDDGGSESWAAWPLTPEQVELAAQSAAVAHSLGLRAHLREKLPPLPQ